MTNYINFSFYICAGNGITFSIQKTFDRDKEITAYGFIGWKEF
jgi:hypothetical protein